MKIITKVEILEVDERQSLFDVFRGVSIRTGELPTYQGLQEFKREDLDVRIFARNIDGKIEQFRISMSKDVQDMIGLPFEAFNQMEAEMQELRKSVLELSYYKNMKFWSRLKNVFWVKKK